MKVVFVIPAHGRFELTACCLGSMLWTCSALDACDVEAGLVVVACDANAATARAFRADAYAFVDVVEQGNRELGRRWNDGFERALELDADYVFPCGSDDIVHPGLVLAMVLAAEGNDMVATRRSCVVSEDGSRLAELEISYAGGDGIRCIPRWLLERVGGRPAIDNRNRAIDASIHVRLSAELGRDLKFGYVASDPRAIVGFKTADANLNSFAGCEEHHASHVVENPFEHLEWLWPKWVLDPIREVYARERV